MNYTTSNFIEIIESIQGILFLRHQIKEVNGHSYHANIYQGLRGNLVIIDTSEEDMDDYEAKGHLTQLGLEYLIPTLFPSN